MSWRAHELAREIERQSQPSIGKIEVELLDMAIFNAFLGPAPNLAGERRNQIFGQAERLADIAQCAFRAITDHGRAQSGMIAAVGLEHPLHDDLSPFVFKIDVDVGRLAALFADEALEQQVVASGIDRGDAENVADGGIRGRAASLAQDVA